MQKVSARHHALDRSIVELGARDPSLVDVPLPVNSVPVVGPLVSPVVGNGAGGSAQPSTSNPQPTPASSTVGGDGVGSAPATSDSPANGGGNVVPPMSPVPGPTSPTPLPGSLDGSSPGNPPGTPSSPSSGGGAGTEGGSQSSSNSGAPGNILGTNGKQTAPVNAGSTTGTTVAADWSGSPSLATGIQSSVPSSLGSGPNAVGTAAPSPTTTTAAAASSGKQFPGGMIAGIIIVCSLVLGALIILVLRRRSISRRLELRRQWWFGRSGGDFPPLNKGGVRSPVGEAPASRLSTCSSFATNFDQGLMLRVDSPPPRLSLGVFPDVPPMAEVRERNSVLISTGGAVARRESMNSMLSSGSDPDAQYLIVTGQDNLEPSTPMSVRPFSPSESFAFPKPPGPPSATMDSFFASRRQAPDSPQSYAATLVHLSSPLPAFMADLPPLSATPLTQTSVPTPTLLSSIAASDHNVDPFADPTKPEFADVEIIYRPFAPSLDDELAVCPGDHVRILQVFDDGWTQVEKLAPSERECHERGLIPVDCLREAGQALPAFLAQKRVSAYGSGHLIGTAL